MLHVLVVLCATTMLVGSPAAVQTKLSTMPEQRAAAYDAHQADFDYLLGDWGLSANSREHGAFRGYWSAIRLSEGQILDEYRVVSESGETIYVTTTIRNYNAFADQWELLGMARGNGLQDAGTARRDGAEMRLEQRFGVAGSLVPAMMRIGYYDIRPDRFSWTTDRSTDGGKTWVTLYQTIEARRIGPARSMGPLAPARSPSAAAR